MSSWPFTAHLTEPSLGHSATPKICPDSLTHLSELPLQAWAQSYTCRGTRSDTAGRVSCRHSRLSHPRLTAPIIICGLLQLETCGSIWGLVCSTYATQPGQLQTSKGRGGAVKEMVQSLKWVVHNPRQSTDCQHELGAGVSRAGGQQQRPLLVCGIAALLPPCCCPACCKLSFPRPLLHNSWPTYQPRSNWPELGEAGEYTYCLHPQETHACIP